MEKIGYARVSTDDQNLELQRSALKANGCSRTFEDTDSGAKANRPGLAAALDYLCQGDSLVVWRLDRLGRSMQELVALGIQLETRGIRLVSLAEKIDTGSVNGKHVLQVFKTLAEFERNLIRERTQAGLRAAKARGRLGGRPKLDPEKARAIKQLMKDEKNSVGDICKTLGISRTTFYRYAKAKVAG